MHITFHKGIDNFEIHHKTCQFWLMVQYPLKVPLFAVTGHIDLYERAICDPILQNPEQVARHIFE